MSQSGLKSVIESRRINAALGWVLLAVLVLSAAGTALRGNALWAGFTLAVVALAVLPAVSFRDPTAMLPWEVLALAAVTVVGRAVVAGLTVAGFTLTGRITTFLAVATLALIVAVEIDVFTPVRMNYSFAVAFVVIATMAAAGLWAVVQWLSDLYLGTAFLLDGRPEHVVERELMRDFLAATVAGAVAGLLFEYYFRRRARARRRLADGGGA